MKPWHYFAWMALWLPVGAIIYFSLNLVVYKYLLNNNFAYLFNTIAILSMTIAINIFLLKKIALKGEYTRAIFNITSVFLVAGVFIADFALATLIQVSIYGM